ncbi:hypothetical protein LEP1GSC024_2569 [Leptospira noguchii str. 2001034031]|uniref:Uncharacterized protein n=1 Tax=Leptospira noguchii str. 2001034031 TaxID=1193053 RepID=M6Y606_9LEPT|nr:hypothetical protein LEP1GSC024_2569 [Leptospira noguchii str. 2001034031]
MDLPLNVENVGTITKRIIVLWTKLLFYGRHQNLNPILT